MRLRLSLLALGAGLVMAVSAPAQDDSGLAVSIELTGEIAPATEAWISSALDDAADEDAPLAIIRLDTPGGLDTSMREIVKDIIAAPMPVVVYVSPDGRARPSAGVFITQAADVAAMAPETNIGSASPITIDRRGHRRDARDKITNDAAAFVRALAAEHGRNPELAEEMVTEATNVTADEALDAGLIDLIAADQDDLLAQLDGFEVEGPKATTIETAGLTVEDRDMPLRYDVLRLPRQPQHRLPAAADRVRRHRARDASPRALIPGGVGRSRFGSGCSGPSSCR